MNPPAQHWAFKGLKWTHKVSHKVSELLKAQESKYICAENTKVGGVGISGRQAQDWAGLPTAQTGVQTLPLTFY